MQSWGLGLFFSFSLGSLGRKDFSLDDKEEMRGDFHKGSDLHVQAEDTKGKRYGGVRGGISSGERILLRVGMKAPSSIGNFALKGRHDPCILPRALAVVEAMTCFVLADHLLWMRQDHL